MLAYWTVLYSAGTLLGISGAIGAETHRRRVLWAGAALLCIMCLAATLYRTIGGAR